MEWTLEKMERSVKTIMQDLIKRNKYVFLDYRDENLLYIDAEGKAYEVSYNLTSDEPIEYIIDAQGKETGDTIPNAKGHFERNAIYLLAGSLAKKGYKHQAVLWACYNPENVPESWTVPYIGKPSKDEIPYLDVLRNDLRLSKFQKWALKVLPEGIVREETGKGSYRVWNFKSMEHYGYQVTCWNSYAFGGTCQCISHEPGYEFKHIITVKDIDELQEMIIDKISANPKPIKKL